MQQALIQAHNTHKGHLFEHKSIELSTYGVLFIGTPHQGSDSASMAKILFSIQRLFWETSDVMVKHIMRDLEELDRQLSQYLSISGQFVTKFFFESYCTLLLSGIKQLVCFRASGNNYLLIFSTHCSEIIGCRSRYNQCRCNSDQ